MKKINKIFFFNIRARTQKKMIERQVTLNEILQL